MYTKCKDKEMNTKVRNFSCEFVEFLDILTEKDKNLIVSEFRYIIEENIKLQNETNILKSELYDYKNNDKYILLEKQNETLIKQNHKAIDDFERKHKKIIKENEELQEYAYLKNLKSILEYQNQELQDKNEKLKDENNRLEQENNELECWYDI